jgi:hypothetical protein
MMNEGNAHPLCVDTKYCFVFRRFIDGLSNCNHICNGQLTKLMYIAMEKETNGDLVIKIRDHFKKVGS